MPNLRRVIRLEKKIVVLDAKLSGDALKIKWQELVAERLAIEEKEPPILRVLDTLCHNELIRAEGYDKTSYVKVNRVQRLLALFVDFNQSALETVARSESPPV
jgi:hypothetical protein